ncbi:hypothetical protein EW146_g2709 [Bondarzewia mesenterica]|uniref:Beta-glucuronidase C-terminal domain-containing protein n=1 Tax=Bondarzewia mesenterica TaxID=1095465 RepID=A0A4S4LZW0_9AGAM|nr:hypothetical protein EW146_g2709 [Bondarzewia mesenterica]
MTVYHPQNGQVIFGGNSSGSSTGTYTASAAAASYTGAAAYNPTILTAPAVPNPAPNTSFGIELTSGGINGLSIKQSGAFYGFSIEMSVANQVLGRNSSFIQVPFLNLLANIVERAGWVQVRVGGNTQESAMLVDSLPNGTILAKDYSKVTGTTQTPPLEYTRDLMYMMNNVSSLVNARWYLGIPFFNTTPFSLDIVGASQQILGDRLLAFQAGNEPDQYPNHAHRSVGYGPYNYFGEISDLVNQVQQDQNIIKRDGIILTPSISYGFWQPEDVWNTNIVSAFSSSIAALTVERYPNNNCVAQFNLTNAGPPVDPQAVFPDYLNHTAGQNLVQPYINSTLFAQQVGKPFIMFETNTASCGGFPGISDSFGAALWALDYGLQMAYGNFTGALLHIGGQNAFYNAFTPPPTNQSSFRQWTIGPAYYAALVMSEALGPSNASQVADLFPNNADIYTPAYAIYENGNPTKVALFNYITDPSGATDINVAISIGGGQTGQSNATPAQVKVKLSETTSSLTDVLQGNLDVQTVQCDQNANTCTIKVPAPGFALVFLTPDSLSQVTPGGSMTFPTTYVTKTINTVLVDSSVLATSNGHSGMVNWKGTTSSGSGGKVSAAMRLAMPGALTLFATAAGAWVLGRRWLCFTS